ncbi:MAG: spermidine synthase, partial [Acidobacteriota bacterium]|nr:spermidine synthase [Acidobacteriota bacterium]
ASTLASAAVLAVFMGGLGAGGLFLGRYAERHARPLALYAHLELAIAASAALTPLLIVLVRRLYLATGGSAAMGMPAATLLRLALTLLVLGIPTVLMGGTMPAAARAIATREDLGRRELGTLYGLNTLGAVTGTLLATFILLETFGNRATLWLAALANVLVALTALLLARREEQATGATEEEATASTGSRRFVLAAAAAVGFAFMLMELVWYRMLAPLLGGTTFTFGLILAMALLGIGLGGVAYTLRKNAVATASAFGLTCALEALLLAIPYALGDRLAVLALLLRPLGAGLGFGGYLAGWAAITFVVVFPTAFLSGLQFPMLVSLLGRGRPGVATDLGMAYAWNTAGSIAGSIAGGFGLLPILSATGTWRAAVLVLVVTAIAASRRSVAVVAAAILAVLAICATGPTAAWRHTPIGAGRVELETLTRNSVENLLHAQRRTTVWEVDGVESSLALADADGYAFIVNGKSDGHATVDGGTQVMGGLVPAALHPDPRRALVVGLGTGSTAGWLGSIPSMERVDVYEIEPAIRRIAAACVDVNRNVLANPKVHVAYGDARELVLTNRQHYDIISSEPSNPYRAGIASLMTVEFYDGAARRLAPGGIFAQFLQAYEIDSATLRVVYATLGSVFPNVETWETKRGDLLLVGSMQPVTYDVARLRERFAQEPYRSAARNVWRATSLEGVLAHYAAGPATALALASDARANTDDRAVLEYGFARTLGNNTLFQVDELRAFARRNADELPRLSGAVDRAAIDAARRETAEPPAPAEVLWREGKAEETAVALEHAFVAARSDPWSNREGMLRALVIAGEVAVAHPPLAARLHAALAKPFAAGLVNDARQLALLQVATQLTPGRCNAQVVAALQPFEHGVPWNRAFLRNRLTCYEQLGHPRAAAARKDYEQLMKHESAPLGE